MLAQLFAVALVSIHNIRHNFSLSQQFLQETISNNAHVHKLLQVYAQPTFEIFEGRTSDVEKGKCAARNLIPRFLVRIGFVAFARSGCSSAPLLRRHQRCDWSFHAPGLRRAFCFVRCHIQPLPSDVQVLAPSDHHHCVQPCWIAGLHYLCLSSSCRCHFIQVVCQFRLRMSFELVQY